MKEFVEERVRNIVDNPSHENIIFHIIPEMAFTDGCSVSIEKYTQDTEGRLFFNDFPPMFHRGRSRRVDKIINFDGVQSKTFSDNSIFSYTQLYKNWIIEAVESFLLTPSSSSEYGQGEIKYYPHVEIEKEVSEKVFKYLGSVSENDRFFPCHIALTLTGIKDFIIPIRQPYLYPDDVSDKIDRDILQTNPVKISSNSKDEIRQALKSIYDTIWNAANMSGTINEILPD